MRESKERIAWRNLISRCTDPANRGWKDYGAKGIRVCAQWLSSYPQFLSDVGPAPNQKRSTWLGRLDVPQSYEPGNVIWTTQIEQENRRAYCQRVTVFGKTMTAAQAARPPGQPSRNTVVRRQQRGTPHETPAVRLPKRPIRLGFNGELLTVAQVSQRLEMTKEAVRYRMRSGWSIEQAVSLPKRKRRPPAIQQPEC